MKKSQSGAQTIDEVAGKADKSINRLIGDLLRALPESPQAEVDGLRAVHQVLAYHLGTVGRMIEIRFQEAGDTGATERLLEERQRLIDQGAKHADSHRREYLN